MNNATDNSTLALLAQADLILLAADLLRPPAQVRPRLEGVVPGDVSAITEAAQLGVDAPAIASAVAQAIQTALEQPPEAWSGEYHRLFEGAMVCPANETAFIRRDKGVLIGDLAGYYRAFGWSASSLTGEKPDHILTELEFLAMLLTMLARAEQDQAVEDACVTRDAMASFVDNHLGDWIIALCDHLREWTTLVSYAQAADAIAQISALLRTAHQWPAPTSDASAAEFNADDTPYECDAVDAVDEVTLTVRGTPL